MIKNWTEYKNSDIPHELRVKIELANDAFGEDPRPEIARILRAMADKVEELDIYTLCFYQSIRDINGNSVGQFAIKPITEGKS